MFGLFKKKRDEASAELMLEMPDDKFVWFVTGMVRQSPPIVQIMRLVAYESLKSKLTVIRAHPNKNIPSDIESFITILGKNDKGSTDASSVRQGWLFQAALLLRVEKLYEFHAPFGDNLAEMWITIAESCTCLPHVIKNDTIWAESDKSVFSLVEHEKDVAFFCLNIIAPKEIRRLETVKNYARTRGFHLTLE